MTRPKQPKPSVHLQSGNGIEEIGGILRYRGHCGATGTARRDFSANLTRKRKDGTVVIVVTCPKCLGWAALKTWKVPIFDKQKGNSNAT